MANSREVFQELLNSLTIQADQSEKEAIIYWILDHQYNLSRIDIAKGVSINHDPNLLTQFITRLNQNEPVQYVLSKADFYGRTFYVDKSVLIPRPETELLVNLAVEKVNWRNVSILDIGTGSGCIANTLALEIPAAQVIATDVSQEALDVAKKNALRFNTNVEFHCHNILNDELGFESLDMVVSNPPYVLNSEKRTMQKNVLDYEPSVALFVDDNDPLLFYRIIAAKAKRSLKAGGFLLAEINERFGKETAELFRAIGFHEVIIVKDIDEKDRVVTGKNS